MSLLLLFNQQASAPAALSGTADGVGAVVAQLTGTPKFTATAAGIGAATGNLTAASLLIGTAAGVGTATANLTAASKLTGTAAGVGSVTAQLQQLTSWLKDNFASTIDAKWRDLQSDSSIVGGKLNVPGSGFFPNYDGLITVSDYKLTGSEVMVEVPQLASGGGTPDTMLMVRLGDTVSDVVTGANALNITFEAGVMYAQKIVGGTQSNINTVTYNATNHRWWRLSESGGTVDFSLSPDGNTWTSFATTTIASLGFNVDSVRVMLLSGYWTGTAPTTPAQFDNLNLPTAVAALSGTAAGVGSVTANLTAASLMSGTAAGVGSATGNLTAAAKMSGTADGVGSVTANLTASSRMTGTAAGVGSVTALLTAAPKMTATAAGIGSVAATLTAATGLSGTAAGVGSASATLSAATGMSGTAAGIGSVSALLTASPRLTGTADGVGSVSALLTASPRLTGTAAGIGSVSASLSVPGSAALSGTAAGIGSVAATLTAAAKMTGTAAGIGTVSALLTASPQLLGTAAGIGTATAALRAPAGMVATAAGIGSAAGFLTVSTRLSGTAAGIGTATGVLTTAITPDALETLVATITKPHNVAAITVDGLTDVVIDSGTTVTVAVTNPRYETLMAAATPMGYWRFQEPSGVTVADTAGTNDGTGTNLFFRGTAGPVVRGGKSSAFDGVDSFVTIPATFPTLAGSALSFSCWVKTSNYAQTSQQLASFYSHTSPNPGWGVMLNLSGTNKLAYWSHVTNAWKESSVAAIADAQWHKVDVTVTSGGTVRFYVDGEKLGTDIAGAVPDAYTGIKMLGAETGGATWNPLNGWMSEVAVFNYALDPGFIRTTWLAGNDQFDDYGLRTAAVVDTIPSVTVATPHETFAIAGPHNTALIAHG